MGTPEKKVTGFYADPNSPIAAMPNIKAMRGNNNSSNNTHADNDQSSWSLFSPVLKLFGGKNEELEGADEMEVIKQAEEDSDGHAYVKKQNQSTASAASSASSQFNEFDPYLFMSQLPPYEEVILEIPIG